MNNPTTVNDATYKLVRNGNLLSLYTIVVSFVGALNDVGIDFEFSPNISTNGVIKEMESELSIIYTFI